MKYMIWAGGIFGVLAFAMVAWSTAGRFMTQKDDMSVMMGLGIVGLLVGLLAAGVAFVVQKVFKAADAASSTEQCGKDEKVCR
jgi:uncharacterized membrane protein